MNTSTSPNTLYRFRSIDALLDKYHELENQTIYFASPDELNDPMEGFRDIIWGGDKIVWANFFKNYVYCLNASYPLYRTMSDSMELEADKLPVEGRWDRLITPQEQRFDGVWYMFHNLPKVSQMIEALANTNRKIRYGELEYYLRLIQSAILVLIIYSSLDYQHIPESQRQQLTAQISNVTHESLVSILIPLALFEKVKNEKEVNVLLREKEKLWNSERINRQLKNPNSEATLEGIDHLSFDFPTVYLNEIERLLWPNWYTACFMKDYHNSSVWGYYADKHEGACLIFEPVKTSGSNGLELYKGIGKRVRVIPFSEISYEDKPGEVDFFRSIGRTTVALLMKLWYTDAEGNVSECAAHIPRDSEIDNDGTIAWRKSYWNSFYRDITTKTKDWKYEQEYRLILEDGLRQFDEQKDRTLKYDFNSLKGIIFGMNTSDEDKVRIIKIIQEKCETNERVDFKFYQAYYAPEEGNIQKYEILLS